MDIREFVNEYVNKVVDNTIAEINKGMEEYLEMEGYNVTRDPTFKLPVNHELGFTNEKVGYELCPVDEDGNFVDTLD